MARFRNSAKRFHARAPQQDMTARWQSMQSRYLDGNTDGKSGNVNFPSKDRRQGWRAGLNGGSDRGFLHHAVHQAHPLRLVRSFLKLRPDHIG